MDITQTLYVTTREAWRDWLAAHHEVKPEIWLVSYRAAAGRPSIPYHEAVEEALCFGWIDGIRKGMDGDRYAQRYTPRRPRSGFSQINKERLARLIAQGKVIPAVLERVRDVRAEDFVFPPDILAALRSDEQAWTHFQRFPAPYQRIRVAYVDDARAQEEVFEKRLRNLIEKTAQGKQFGYGIEDFY